MAKISKRESPSWRRNFQFSTSFGKFIDQLPFAKFVYICVGIIILCGIYFYLFNPYGNGTSKANISFGDSLYFSVITFTSLGYGDISPMGFGKLVASIEVLLGLIL